MALGALSDIRILDFTQNVGAPFGTMMLADHGAEVIKIETGSGDPARHCGPFRPDDILKTHGGSFQSLNRGKKSVLLELETIRGKEAFHALVRTADVVAENYSEGILEQFGLTYEALMEINPKLVFASFSGFGNPRTGSSPYTNWPESDLAAQSIGGIAGITGSDDENPTLVGTDISEVVGGINFAFGILSAVHQARKTGQGQMVDVSTLDSVFAVCERMVYQNSVSGVSPGPLGNGHPFFCPFGMFPAKDGFVTIAAPQQEFFDAFCDLIDLQELKNDERFSSPELRGENRKVLEKLIANTTARYTKAELMDRLGGKIPFGPVMQMDSIADDPHFSARDMLVAVEQPGSTQMTMVAGVPVKLSETPGQVRGRGPHLGEHTEAILREVGISESEITRLKSDPAP